MSKNCMEELSTSYLRPVRRHDNQFMFADL
jgi:hypothetical protein